MDSSMIGAALAGKSSRTGSRFLKNCPIPVYLVGNKRYVARADFEAWLESRRIEPQKKPPNSLKQWLDDFVEAEMKKAATGG